MYKHVIFDLYGTLIDIDTDEHSDKLWETMAQLTQAYGAQYTATQLKDTFFELCDKQLQHNGTVCQNPDIDVVKVWQQILKASKNKVNKADATHCAKTMRMLSINHIQLYKGVLPLLTKLKKAKVPMYLLCNGQKPYVTAELRLLGIGRFFGKKIISSDYGQAKPSKDMFDLILKANKIDTTQAIMIGNDLTSDIAGANGAGIDSIYLDNGTVSSGKGSGILSTYGITDGDYSKVYDIITKPVE